METAALGPTLKRYSLRISANDVPANKVPANKVPANKVPAIIALTNTTLAMRPLIRSSDCVMTQLRCDSPASSPLSESYLHLRQRPVHRQLKEQGLFLIGLHQRAASFFVSRIRVDHALSIVNVLVHPAQVVFVLRLHCRRLLRDFLQ